MGHAAAYDHDWYVALAMEGVETVVLGCKNTAELRECVAAEAEGPLESEIIARIDSSVSRD